MYTFIHHEGSKSTVKNKKRNLSKLNVHRNYENKLTFRSLCGTVLQNVNEARYPGINLSKDLQWGWVNHPKHCSQLSWSLEEKFVEIKCPQKLREQAYISLIRSRLECCAAVWDPYLIKDINTLEGIQRRAATFFIQNHSRFNSVSSLLKDLNWAPLNLRRDIRL